MLDLFSLGELERRREGKIPSDKLTAEALNYAIEIREHLDSQEDKKEKTQFKKVLI